jgi:hypothetical protein
LVINWAMQFFLTLFSFPITLIFYWLLIL